MPFLEKLNNYLTQGLIWGAGFFVVAMVLLVCTNVFMRTFWKPLTGTFELIGYFSAVAMAFALGYTQIKKGHIAVDIMMQRFSRATKDVLAATNCLICMLFFALVSWQLAKYAHILAKTGEVTETLHIPYYPFTYAVALGCAVLSMVFLIDLVRYIFLLISQGDKK